MFIRGRVLTIAPSATLALMQPRFFTPDNFQCNVNMNKIKVPPYTKNAAGAPYNVIT